MNAGPPTQTIPPLFHGGWLATPGLRKSGRRINGWDAERVSYIANILRYKPTFDIVVEGNQCDSPPINDGFISPFLCYWLVFLSIDHEDEVFKG